MVAIEINRVRAKAPGRTQRHGRMHAELSRFVARCGNDAALIGSATDDDRFAAQFRPLEQFNGHKERVHVDMQNRSDAGQRLLIDRTVYRAKTSHVRHRVSVRCSLLIRQNSKRYARGDSGTSQTPRGAQLGALTQCFSAAMTRGMPDKSFVTPTFVHEAGSSNG